MHCCLTSSSDKLWAVLFYQYFAQKVKNLERQMRYRGIIILSDLLRFGWNKLIKIEKQTARISIKFQAAR